MVRKIIIADPHSVARNGIRRMLHTLGIIGAREIESGEQLKQEIIREKYTHLIIEPHLPDDNSPELVSSIRELYPELNILVFSMVFWDSAEEIIATWKKAGIDYLPKMAPTEEATRAIRHFLQKESSFGIDLPGHE